jgi:hypothetical protein
MFQLAGEASGKARVELGQGKAADPGEFRIMVKSA